MVLHEAGHTQNRASHKKEVAVTSRDAPRSARSRGILLSEDVGGYENKRNKGIDRRRYVEERKVQ